MMSNEKSIYKTKRPLWHSFLAFIFYFIGIMVFIKSIILLIERHGVMSLKFITATVFFLFCAIGLSFIREVFVDASNKIRIRYTLFNFKIVDDFIFEEIKYISVFSDATKKDFTVFFGYQKQIKKILLHYLQEMRL